MIVKRSSVLATVKTINAIWSFKRKRKPDGELLKHKAWIWFHGGMHRWGESYWETYYPVLNILSVQLLICIEKIHIFDLKAIKCLLTFPQAKLNKDIWMQLPVGFQVDGKTKYNSEKRYWLKIEVSLYGLKQASFNWYKKLKKALEYRKYPTSDIDCCLYLGNCIILWTYADECIIVGNNMKEIDSFIDSLRNGP